jgi:molybdopterin molybdotransferase
VFSSFQNKERNLVPDLLTVHEARLRLLSYFKPLDTIQVPFMQGLGRVLAQTVSANEDSPHFPNSAMDGFVVRSADCLTASRDVPIILPVVGEIRAGDNPTRPLANGRAMRIMTGAPIPQEADAVIPLEDITEDSPDTTTHTIVITTGVKPGQYIRPRGQDIRQGDIIFNPGRRLFPQDIGLLAALGVTEIKIYASPKVALLSSGDELVQPNEALAPGKIRDANSSFLESLLTLDHAAALPLGIAADSMISVQEKLDTAVDQNVDLIITSAWVSVGSYDFVRSVITSKGNLDFWRVNIRPGKPIAFGHYRNTPVIGLPGNPVSAFVGYQVFVRPVLDRLSGIPKSNLLIVKALLAEDIQSDGRESYLRGKLDPVSTGTWKVSLVGHQGSGNLRALSEANALLIIPSGVKSLPAGSEVDAWLFNSIV